ncbi:hypothetical protein BS47DRAFT_1373465 [Hydnum rufescens UP504]|uniref:DRMBL-domain-containing protein n=1 Tax=Hydnum rufescens UP504 TaxID=1448309 RepID=A0A9P6DSM1_9AGAM|nr:hypothetical protein BS47DRAFT_1373465 [Hydnum rufescens UP504]
MSGHKENEAWKEAEVDSARAAGGSTGRRLAPFFKVMQGMPIAVDAFRYGKIPGVKAYLLTHAHSDHYTNLSSNWKNGPIYCSETTANLIKYMLRVDPKWVHPLPLDIPIVIPDTEVTVTLIEANHCPGSVLYLFEGRQTVNAGDSTFKSSYIGSPKIFRYLHCGDYRASPRHVLHPAVKGKNLDLIYMDTTYLDPKHCFPPQKQVIDACAALARRHILGPQSNEDGLLTQNAERILVVVGTYSIGKERIVKAIAQALCTKVYSDARKRALLLCQDDPELHALLTSDPLEGCVHLVPLQHVNSDKIGDYLAQFKGAYTRVLGFRPTGWTPDARHHPLIARMQAQTFLSSSLTPMRNSNHKQMLYGVPYSEHSSFFELTCFALSVDWGKIIATVNVGSQVGRSKMSRWFERWELERRRRKEKGDSLIVPSRSDEYW